MNDYYLIIQGKDIGPYTLDELKKLMRNGEVAGNMLVRCGQDIRPARKIVRWSWKRAAIIGMYATMALVWAHTIGLELPEIYWDCYRTSLPEFLLDVCRQLTGIRHLITKLCVLTSGIAVVAWFRGHSLY